MNKAPHRRHLQKHYRHRFPHRQLQPPSPLALPPLPNFLNINGDSSPHCPLTQEFLPVPPTTFAADAAMCGDSAMKSGEAGAPLCYYNKKILTSKNLFIQPDYLELYNHIPSNVTMLGKISPQCKTKGNRRGKKTMRSLTTFGGMEKYFT